jgi:hypothetical protein
VKIGAVKDTRGIAPKLRQNRFKYRATHALTDFLRSNKIEILNVAGPRESKEPGVYEWTLTMLRFSLSRAFWNGIQRSGQ